MRKTLSFAFLVAVLMSAVAANAQSPDYNVGPVWRVTYVHIKPGQTAAFWNDVRQNFKPIYDELKKQGMILDYKFYTNPVSDRPNDWDIAFALLYPNWGALDQLAAKAFTIAEKHYGSREALAEAARKRNDIVEFEASHLAREVTLK